MKINQTKNIITEIDNAVNYVSCVNTDDEDCSTSFSIDCEANRPPEDSSGSGSSGSGKLYDDTANNEPISIVVVNPRRYNDGGKDYKESNNVTEESTNIVPIEDDIFIDVVPEYSTPITTATSIRSTRMLQSSSTSRSDSTTQTSVQLKATNSYESQHGSGFSVHSISVFTLLFSLVITYIHF